ncbi:hypothetical protein D7V80_11695 [Corallococcus sp. CA054B]|uniref:hypothetical protein n=1 Tax=Corallococcus sp. CA054B TaxID=2316734 RepID=UPI000EA1AD52|nr:hypothetical protein [Corallococcus sp. CA054B]RKG68655.1 hypothetical protein D7V80_11695 [Corallococcus sp. CA054B]
MPALTQSDVYTINANEARKRDLRLEIARIKGQLDASAALSRQAAEVNSATLVKKTALEQELAQLESAGAAPGSSDDWGKYSTVEMAAQDERFYAKDKGYDWLVFNPLATFEETVAEFEKYMLEQRTARGRPWLLQRGEGLIHEWQANAFARGLIAEDSWPAFRDWLLIVGKERAVSSTQ